MVKRTYCRAKGTRAPRRTEMHKANRLRGWLARTANDLASRSRKPGVSELKAACYKKAHPPMEYSIMLKYAHARCQTDVMGETHGNDTAGF